MAMERMRKASGSPFEETIGFSRGIRVGEHVYVSGTAPIWPDGSCDPDAERQAARCFEIIGGTLEALGSSLGEVVRTRTFLVDAGDAEAVSRAHKAAIGRARPASTMVVVAALLDPRWRVEIEADAMLGPAEPEPGGGG